MYKIKGKLDNIDRGGKKTIKNDLGVFEKDPKRNEKFIPWN